MSDYDDWCIRHQQRREEQGASIVAALVNPITGMLLFIGIIALLGGLS